MLNSFFNKLRPHRKVVENFGYLTVLQVFNMVLPLVTYPYLIRVLGKEIYGLIIYAQAIANYFVLIVSYGFNISGVKEVSINRDNKEKINEIFSCIMLIKFALLIASFLILYLLLTFTPLGQGYHNLYYLSMWLCVYELIFPIWYFQGTEKMKYITIISFTGRIIFLGLIFVVIETKKDFLYVPILNGVGALIAGTVSLVLIFTKDKVKFVIPKLMVIRKHLADSFSLFLSIISIKIYTITNRVILGSFVGMTAVSYYDLADKIITILKTPSHILSQSIFPRVSKYREIDFVTKMFKISFVFNIIIFGVLIITSKYIIGFLGGIEMQGALPVTIILGILIPVAGINNMLGVQMLVGFGYQKVFTRGMIISSFIYLLVTLLICIMTDVSLITLSLSLIITEIFVSFYMYFYTRKLKLL